MKNSNTKISDNCKKLLQCVKSCFSLVHASLVATYKYSHILKKALYTTSIINILQNNTELLKYLSADSQKHLSTILKKYGKQAIEVLKQKSYQIEEVPNLTIYVEQLVEYLDHYFDHHEEKVRQAPELQIIVDLIESFIRQCCALIAMNHDYQEHLNRFQALTIVLSVDNLSAEQQNLLTEQLLLIKELWQIDHIGNNKKEPTILLFHANILSLLQQKEHRDYEEVLTRITKFLLSDHNVLLELPSTKLMDLYNRLNGSCDESQIYQDILLKIHEESKFRLNYNKINNHGYELCKLFDNYNTILHQIENAEFAIAERFLLRKSAFLHEVLINITKHIDSIIILSVTDNLDLIYILQRIRKDLTQNIQNGHTISLMISSVESKLSSNINPKIIKRYGSFDKFTRNALKNRYQVLFKNIILLLEMDKNYEEFIQNTIISKIAADYKEYKINTSSMNSSSAFRVIEYERIEIIKQLYEINFIELFGDKYFNKISSLNFKKYARKETTKTSLAYVKLVIIALLNNLTVEQLQVVLRFLTEGNLVTLRNIVKQELLLQVKKRMSLGKILYYVFTRRKNELITLNNIKRALNACS